MKSIEQLRQMMAETKFSDVQKLIEIQISRNDETSYYEYLQLYQEVLRAQDRGLPIPLIIDLARCEFEHHNISKAHDLIEKISSDDSRPYQTFITQIKVAKNEMRGRLDEMYQELTQFLLFQFENQVPHVPEYIQNAVNKYFKDDFRVNLNLLGILLLADDTSKAEEKIKTLIISCVEGSSSKGTNHKINSIHELLGIFPDLKKLVLYRNLCEFLNSDQIEKNDYKKIIELCIYFDEYNFQVIILSLLDKFGLLSEGQAYAEYLKNSPHYDFVYIAKFFRGIKKYFVREENQILPRPINLVSDADLVLETSIEDISFENTFIEEKDEDEQKYFNLLKYQDFSLGQLCDLTVSFLQSEMPKVALNAAELAIKKSKSDKDFLKACYLKITCLLQLKDNRAALDLCFVALSKSQMKDDILSFLYAQAEIYSRIKDYIQAKNIYLKILSIDSSYRMTRERLDKLNEI